MKDFELLSIVSRLEQDASTYNGELNALNERLLMDYLQEPYGDEVEDQSQVISPDVQDVVESDMPSLARVFLGSKQPITFEPTGASEQEAKEVDEKNKYVHHLIMEQPWSYSLITGWMKEASICKQGVVKYFMDDTRKSREVHFENVSPDEFYQIVESLPNDAEIVGQHPNDDGTFNLSFKVIEGRNQVKIINVPGEQFLISKGAATIDDAVLVGDRVSKSRGELLSEGYPRELIEKLPALSTDDSLIDDIRHSDTGGDEDNYSDWANEKVELRDLYVKVDWDGDGIAERRHILKSGNHILENEAFDHVPYASLSGILMPHKVIGRSRAELTQSTQKTKTVVLRQTLNNMYAVNHPRNVVHPDVNIDDMLQIRPNGLVRMKSSTRVVPGQAVFPLVTPYIGDKSLQVLTYLDQTRSQSTGMLQANQGLDGTGITEETASRFNGVREDGREKIELVARNFAETGFRKLYEGVAWMVQQFQDEETEILVLGKPLTVNPQNWKYNNYIVCKVGTGSGDSDKLTQTMNGILSIQAQLAQTGSPLVDQVKLYNTLDELVGALGVKQTEKFFNNPEVPEQLLQAENEILKLKLQEAGQLLQGQGNPLAEAEQVKGQVTLLRDQLNMQKEAMKMNQDNEQFMAKLAADKEENDKQLALKLTELEAKFNQELDAKLQENTLTFDPQTGSFSGTI